jgi:hypothetical protein
VRSILCLVKLIESWWSRSDLLLESNIVEQGSVIWFCCHRGKTTSGLAEECWHNIEKKVAEQISVMKVTLAVCLLRKCQTVLNELMMWFKRTHRLLSLTYPRSWTSAVGVHACSTICDDFMFHKMCGRWVPEQRIDAHGNMHAVFAVMLWKRRGSGFMMGSELWTC